ncbi:glycoside hydrolase family 3 N-terminal domain-containing protein [Agromyces sp. NPDC056523]|uniref:glycoside hydrolase family 3 N-terminal domain-containing protein n=1 Tax=Agromyces sp. NPDC056523 TaxID=3345850 RepID=UPI00366CF4DE
MATSAEEHLDLALSPEERAELLLRRMTLREKCHQLVGVPPWSLVNPDLSEPADLEATLARAPGHISNFAIDDPRRLSQLIETMQRRAVEQTRLGIPLLIHTEALNGLLAGGHMVFPTGIGLASTWSPELVQEMADLSRRQMRRVGIRQALAPVMDVALDPRWGRVHETYGEDPYLSAAMSVAYTRGLQTQDLRNGVIATAKHFIGYGLAEAGVNLSGAETGARRLRDLFAYPFEAAIQLAGLGSVMNAYSDLDRVPAAASREILTDLLRETLGFDGFVSADYMTTEQLVDRQKVAASPAEAGRLAIAAGLDTEFPTPFGYGDTLVGEVERGGVDVALVDRAARRILQAKFRLGLFENPYPAEQIDLDAVATEGRELSADLARRSIVLLQNDGLLPLAPGSLDVAVIGPHADAIGLQFPTYTYPAFREMTLVMSSGGMGNMVGADPGMIRWNQSLLPPMTTERYVRETYGARALWEEIADHAKSVTTAPGSTLTNELAAEDLQVAIDAAKEADVVVLALGGASLWFNGERTEGEASDSADIALPAAQAALAYAIVATGTPVVVVLAQGRAYTLPEAVQNAAAVVIAPYGGPFGPKAVAEVLFGVVNPSGKLPYSIPRHTGQIPIYHHKVAGSGHRNPLPPGTGELYLDMPATPLHPFGHGLSYTDFSISEATGDAEVAMNGTARIAGTITNTGERAGASVVQLYLRVNTSGVTRPAQQLAGFARIDLAPGESRRLRFEVRAEQLGYTNLAREFVVEPARVDWFVGLDSDDRRATGSFELRGDARALTSAERAFLSEVVIEDA